MDKLISGFEGFGSRLEAFADSIDGKLGKRVVADRKGENFTAAAAAIDASSQNSQDFLFRSSSPSPSLSGSISGSSFSEAEVELPEEESEMLAAIEKKRAASAQKLERIVNSDRWGEGKKVKVDLTPLVQELRERAKDKQEIISQVERDFQGKGTVISITSPMGTRYFQSPEENSDQDGRSIAQELLSNLKTAIKTTYTIKSVLGKAKERLPDEVDSLAHQALTFATQKGEQAVGEQICNRLQKKDSDVMSPTKIHRDHVANIAVSKEGIVVSGENLRFMMVVNRENIVYDYRLDNLAYQWNVTGQENQEATAILRKATEEFVVPRT